MATVWLFHLIIGLVVALEYRADTDVAVHPINHDTTRAATGMMDASCQPPDDPGCHLSTKPNEESSSYPPSLHQRINHHPLSTTASSSNTGGSRRYKRQTGCATKPTSPANGRIKCSAYSGCRATCSKGFQFPSGERRLFLECNEEDGQWKVAGDLWETLPDCIPVCLPSCQNNGICSAPNVCECPDDWEGPTCEVPKKKECGNKPPTPKNSRIICGKDECMARCLEDYEFEKNITHLTFECLDGDWIIKHSQWTTTPDCELHKLVTTTTTPTPRTTTTEVTTSPLSEGGWSSPTGTSEGSNSSDVSPSYRRSIIWSTIAPLVTTLLLYSALLFP